MGSTYWAGEMGAGEVAVFHFDGRSRVLCGADGSLGTARAVKFGTVAEAVSYAEGYVEAHGRRGCRLHDRSGACIREIRGTEVPVSRYSRAQAMRDLCIGLMGFLLIPIGFLIDRWVGWSIFLGAALGTKFVLLGIIKLSEGLAGLTGGSER